MSVKSEQFHVVSEREVPFSVHPDADVNPDPGTTTLYQGAIDQLAMILCSWEVGGTTALTITARGAATGVKMLAPRYRAKNEWIDCDQHEELLEADLCVPVAETWNVE
jgi:hypothetical protein